MNLKDIEKTKALEQQKKMVNFIDLYTFRRYNIVFNIVLNVYMYILFRESTIIDKT